MTLQKSCSIESQEVASLITFTSSYEQKWKAACDSRALCYAFACCRGEQLPGSLRSRDHPS